MAVGRMGKTNSRQPQKRRICNPGLSRMKTRLRVLSNIGLVTGQCILLFASREVGLVVIICSSLLSVPFFLKEGMIDVLVLILFSLCINIAGLLFR
jgi:hypothetical protein